MQPCFKDRRKFSNGGWERTSLPCQTMLDDVQIDVSSYVVVKVDIVHVNSRPEAGSATRQYDADSARCNY
jgi:hypothetical protein